MEKLQQRKHKQEVLTYTTLVMLRYIVNIDISFRSQLNRIVSVPSISYFLVISGDI